MSIGVAATPFRVVTEFAFEEVQARSAGIMTDKVMKISEAAKEAQRSIKLMGMEMVLQFTGLGGGLIGMAHKLVGISEGYKQAKLDLAQMAGSVYKLGAGQAAYNRQLEISEKGLLKVSKIADKFALDEQQVMYGAMPMMGTLGTKKAMGKFKGDPMEAALDLSRLATKFGTQFGMDAQTTSFGMVNTLEGAANPQLVFVRKLFAETGDVLKKFGITTHTALNEMMKSKPDKAIKALTAAFNKFSGDTKALTERARSFTGAMIRMKNIFMGFHSVLRPLGDLVNKLVTRVLNKALDIINTTGRHIIKQFAGVLEKFLDTPEKFIARLMELSKAGDNMAKAGWLVSIGIFIYHFKQLIAWLGKFTIVQTMVGALGRFFMFLRIKTLELIGMTGAGKLLSFTAFGKAFAFLVPLILKGVAYVTGLMTAMAGLFIIFQGFSRALARIKAQWIASMKDPLNEIVDILTRFKDVLWKLWRPIDMAIEGMAFLVLKFAELIGIYNSTSATLKKLGGLKLLLSGLEAFANWVDMLYFKLNVLGAYITGWLYNLGKVMSALLIQRDLGKTMTRLQESHEIGKEFARIMGETLIYGDKKKEPVARSVVNIKQQTNNINQDFKGEVNPDRIAFSITKHLKQFTENATQARGKTFGNLGKTNMVTNL